MSTSPRGDQFYVTHCTTDDSVLNDPGYTVRAASPGTGRDLLEWAFRYPPYELPIELWRDQPQPAAAPSRLALTHDKNKAWVVHSAYLAKDTVGRDRSYFSHLMRLDAADPAHVLASWGAAGWVKSYPQGAPKSLPPNPLVPTGALVTDDNLTTFLNDPIPAAWPADLSTTICPARLRARAAARKELFARVLHAVLLLHAEQNEQRRRLYVHAEPGLIALLLYGACRLLPSEATEHLTFSTFEPHHRNFRGYKLADVVGTFLGGDKGLEPDFGTRTLALDTFKDASSSPDLRGDIWRQLDYGVSALIDLAARGEWNLLPAVRDEIGSSPRGLSVANDAITRARELAKVDDETATLDELLAIQGDRSGYGPRALKARAEKVLPKVKAAALDPRHPRCKDARAAFRELLAAASPQLWKEAYGAIKRDDGVWESRWALLREVAPAKAEEYLKRTVFSDQNEDALGGLPNSVRARMRSACKDAGLFPPQGLLMPVGKGELDPQLVREPLLAPAGPPEWGGYTAFVLLAPDEMNWLANIAEVDRKSMREQAKRYLFTAPPAALAAYAAEAREYLARHPGFLTTLFVPHSPTAAAMMDKLLTTTALKPADWLNLCVAVGLTQGPWGDYLLEKNRLATLLVRLGGEGAGKEVWAAYLGLLSLALISPDLIATDDGTDAASIHAWERKVHNHLRVAAEQLSAAGHQWKSFLAPEGVRQLTAANNLIAWVNDPAGAAGEGNEEVLFACQQFGIDPLDLVRVAYKKGGYDQLDLTSDLAKLGPIIALFQTCYPVDDKYHTARAAVTQWLKLSQECPKPTRGLFQSEFVVQVVPNKHYAQLLGESRQCPFEPFAVTRLNKEASQPSRKGAKYVPPPPRAAAAPNPFEVVPDPEPAAPADGADGGPADADGIVEGTPAPKKKYKPGGNKGKLGVFLIVGLLVVGGAAVAGVVAYTASRPDAPSDQAKENKPDPKPPKGAQGGGNAGSDSGAARDGDVKAAGEDVMGFAAGLVPKQAPPPKADPAASAGPDAVAFAASLIPAAPRPDPAASAGPDLLAFAAALIPAPARPADAVAADAGAGAVTFGASLIPSPPAAPVTADVGGELMAFAASIISARDNAKDPPPAGGGNAGEVMKKLGDVPAKISNKFQRLRFWN